MNIWKDFHGPNAGYILELYERYLKDRDSVDTKTRALFDQWKPETDGLPTAQPADVRKIVGAVNLAQAIRTYGHLDAQLGRTRRGRAHLGRERQPACVRGAGHHRGGQGQADDAHDGRETS